MAHLDLRPVPGNRESFYTHAEVSSILLDAKNRKGFTFDHLAKKVGREEVWLAAAMYGQHPFTDTEAAALCQELDIHDSNVIAVLKTIPVRGYPNQDELANDPTIYRLHEIIKVYGLPLKSIINEKFGDGIMSGIDFHMSVDKREDANDAQRVIITFNGKFLPYPK